MEIVNKKAPFNFLLSERFEAGIVLTGAEAQSIRHGRIDLSNSHVKIIKGEAFLVNANIPVTGVTNYVATRSRKLLLHRSQLLSLHTKTMQQDLSLIPTKVYTTSGYATRTSNNNMDTRKGHLIKLQIAYAKGKKKFEKKATLKLRDQKREAEEELKVQLK